MAQKLAIYKKGETTPLATGDPSEKVSVTGLAAGTVVADGDYQAAVIDDTNAENPSGKVDVPGWTVLKKTEPEPTNVKATATEDGADVTADVTNA
ncbi:hypothetical protein EFS12_01820 [Levilactobacillus brevis]|uniref:Uncharacterized protein n=1 Tax=Levilactobacillus brevis TaxID=1580 RepID=A0AB38X623_LEVBR|nr:hypothetical protein [Levilactobacillus brevis]MCT3586937.1 hypothetical protein [Levilactobacillus brevis]QOP52675.1 hypothetical protein HCC75_04655 [Levilactobacillus brevis]WAD02133.1 hypothetical protein ORR04_02735 [Levilactobacillus brevis]STX20384.1 Uncharacterised protein [Levilactobacillus brevis]GEB75239.1 hypothetical protein LBR04_19780 [Levilactobacillus brevis]